MIHYLRKKIEKNLLPGIFLRYLLQINKSFWKPIFEHWIFLRQKQTSLNKGISMKTLNMCIIFMTALVVLQSTSTVAIRTDQMMLKRESGNFAFCMRFTMKICLTFNNDFGDCEMMCRDHCLGRKRCPNCVRKSFIW